MKVAKSRPRRHRIGIFYCDRFSRAKGVCYTARMSAREPAATLTELAATEVLTRLNFSATEIVNAAALPLSHRSRRIFLLGVAEALARRPGALDEAIIEGRKGARRELRRQRQAKAA